MIDVLFLGALAALIGIPISQYKCLWLFTVGYGSSVAFVASILWLVFQPHWPDPSALVITAAIFYGMRLSTYLFIRDMHGWTPVDNTLETTSRLNRVVLATAISILFSCMTLPMLYAVRNQLTGPALFAVAYSGAILAWLGAIGEAIADGQKHLAKKKAKDNRNRFVGPLSGLYRITRHPNYTSEVAFWAGVYLTGLPSFCTSNSALLISSAGLYMLTMIMVRSTRDLEKRQKEKYGGQKAYEEWTRAVPSLLFPGVY